MEKQEVINVLLGQAKMSLETAHLGAPQDIPACYFYEILTLRSTAQMLFGKESEIFRDLDHLLANYNKPMPQPEARQ